MRGSAVGLCVASLAVGSSGGLGGFPAALRLILLCHFMVSVLTSLHYYRIKKKDLGFITFYAFK